MTDDINDQVAALTGDFREYGQKVYSNVGKAVLKGCLAVEREAKQSIVGPSTETSAPGEPPKIKTGRLRSSITHRVKYEGQQVVGEIGTNVEYGGWLEYGTTLMAPRPFMGPALDKHEKEIYDDIDKAEQEAEGAFHA